MSFHKWPKELSNDQFILLFFLESGRRSLDKNISVPSGDTLGDVNYRESVKFIVLWCLKTGEGRISRSEDPILDMMNIMGTS